MSALLLTLHFIYVSSQNDARSKVGSDISSKEYKIVTLSTSIQIFRYLNSVKAMAD